MFKPYLQFLITVTVTVTLSGACLLAQESPAIVPDQMADSDLAVAPSPLVRAHMQRVQAWFDESNNPIFYRLAFVASISDIRPRRPTDMLIGELGESGSDVVVLDVRVLGRNTDVGFKESSEIFFPVGELRSLWKSRNMNVEMLFEYNRIGKRGRVQKFGC